MESLGVVKWRCKKGKEFLASNRQRGYNGDKHFFEKEKRT